MNFAKYTCKGGGGASFFYIFCNFSRKITSWLQRVYRVSCHIIICDPAVCDTIIPTIASIKPIVDFLSRFKQNFANPILLMTMILVADSSCILQVKQRIPFFSKYFMETCAYWVCSAPLGTVYIGSAPSQKNAQFKKRHPSAWAIRRGRGNAVDREEHDHQGWLGGRLCFIITISVSD